MSINKHKLVYDTTDGGDVVGSYLRASDGTLLTHTDVGGKKSLDVNVANTVTVSATDLDIRDLDFATDSVDVSGSEVSLDAATLAALENITVSATDLDIRDLTHVSDSVKVGDGTDFLAVNNDGSVNITDNGGSLTVDATNLDIRDLVHTADSIRLGDGTNFFTSTTVGADIGLDVNLINAADIQVQSNSEYAEDAAHVSGDIGNFILSVRQDSLSASAADGDYQAFKTDSLGRIYTNDAHQNIAHNAVTVTTTATDLAATDLANRKRILIQNRGTKPIFIGNASVTATNGVEVPDGSSIELDAGAAIDLHAITASGSSNVRVLELA